MNWKLFAAEFLVARRVACDRKSLTEGLTLVHLSCQLLETIVYIFNNILIRFGVRDFFFCWVGKQRSETLMFLGFQFLRSSVISDKPDLKIPPTLSVVLLNNFARGLVCTPRWTNSNFPTNHQNTDFHYKYSDILKRTNQRCDRSGAVFRTHVNTAWNGTDQD
jgi:hypothetical protein